MGLFIPNSEYLLIRKEGVSFPVASQPSSHVPSVTWISILFMFPKVKKKVIQVLRGKNLLIYIISACYDMVTPAHTADFFLYPKEEFFPFKNTFFSRRNTFETNISILSGN